MAASWTFFDPSPGDTAIVVSTRQSFIYDFTGVWQMGNALAGANSNISSLSGLTTPLSVSQGGTAGNTAATARAGIGAAAAGVNSDITSLSGLTTPLSIAQGGTGVTSGIFPPGAMIDYAGSAAPAGWLLATGQAVSRTTYAALFAVISTTYGAGDGSTTFNVPDARGRVLAGLDNMGGIDAARMASIGTRLTLGGVGGADTHTLTTAQLASHAHTGTTTTDPGHIHSIGTVGLNVAGGTAQVAVPPQNASTINTNSGGAHAHTFTSDASGSGAAHNNVPPTLFINKIIKT
ncbi:MAG: tail fiber protein [Rhizobiales bacterium]|nr:tail fiber protein [Hyphomicrobiales bacterium]